jgi:hypothetical protein
MRKIKLDLEGLSVESFDTAAARRDEGTVVAHEVTANARCASDDCGTVDSGSCSSVLGTCTACYTQSGGWPPCV